MRKFLLVLAVIFTASVVSAANQDGKELFENRCIKCHLLERALNKTKSLEAWERTITRMAKYSGGVITDSEVIVIAGYLAGMGAPAVAVEKREEVPDVPEEHAMFKFDKVRVDQFIDSSVCGECHSDIYDQWSGSMHSKAFIDPIWRSATKLFFKEATSSGEILEMKACVKCHTPLGFRSYSISSPGDDYDKLAEVPAQGIFCNWCHNISDLKHIGDAGYEVSPGGGEDSPSTMLGPRKDADSDFHPTKYSELHTRSEFCGLCHNVSHAENGLPIEATYNEWKGSPYNTGNPETSVHCQDCHMRQRPGIPSTGKTSRPDNPGRAADSGPDREHIWTHYFVGGNSVVTKLLGGEVNSKMAVERLKNAADMEIIKESSYSRNELSSFRVKVFNSGAGHFLPTGITEVRQMWLDVSITDSEGETVFRSGALDKNGNIDKNAVIYHTLLGNQKGEPVLNVAMADRVLYDYRIPPKGYVIERYSFMIPDSAVFPLKIDAVLKYRSASQSLADTLLGESAPKIPVIDMVSVTDRIGG